jgi:protein transport protein SEC24
MAPALMFCIDVSLAAVQVSVDKQSPSHTQIPNHHPITDRSLSIRAVGRDDVGGGGDRANAGLVPEPKRTLVGICTYDSVIHFYHMHDGMATPRMLVVPDADEPYSVSIYFYFVFVFRISISISFRTGNSIDVLFCKQPLPAGMAVSLEDNRANIDSVLKQIPEMFANNRHGSPVGTAAVKACIEALKPHGGRVLAFMVSLFIFSTGQLV